MARFTILRTIYESLKSGSVKSEQFVPVVQGHLDDERDVFKNFTMEVNTSDTIPSTSEIPKEDRNRTTKWLKISDITCCYADMVNSTRLSTQIHDKSTAEIYRYFTGTIIKIFQSFDAAYVDVKGDGVFALFDSGDEHAALAAMVTIKTFIKERLEPDVQKKRNKTIKGHYGISKGTLLVRRIGSRRYGDDDQGRNEVWAGKAVNQAAKLASLAKDDCLLVSNHFYGSLKAEGALRSCGCVGGVPSDDYVNLWDEIDLSDHENLKISTGWSLASRWCQIHGAETCQELLEQDD